MKIDIDDLKNKISNLKTSLFSEPVFETDNLTPAAVLIPVFEKNNESHLLFTKRTDKVRHHKGQISFPGGKYEISDQDLQITALRETYEEIGLKMDDVNIIGKINNMVTNTSFIVSPYVGIIPYPYEFQTSNDEIAELIEVPVSHLLDKKCFREEIREYNGKTFPVYYFDYGKYTIWGVTGKILLDFLTLLSDIYI